MHKVKGFLLSLLVLVLLLTSAHDARAAQASLQGKILTPTEDSYVSNRGQNSLWASADHLRVEQATSLEYLAFLKFDLSPIPDDSTVDTAKLLLYASYVDPKTTTVGVYYCPNNGWTEQGITYDNKPSYSTTPIDSTNVKSSNSSYNPYEWNVTQWSVTGTVQLALGKAGKTLSLALQADALGSAEFYSREAAWGVSPLRPQLDIIYVPPPPSSNQIPTELGIFASAAIAAAALGTGFMLLKKRKTKQAAVNPTQPRKT